MLKREEVERIKEKYPKGTPIRLYSMEGEHTVPPGSRGVVDHVDDIGQIHMKWENGRLLCGMAVAGRRTKMVQLVEITGVLNEKGCIEIPIVLLAQTGIRTGEEVNLIYLAAGEKDYRNESREFMLKRAEEDPLEELQSGETELKLPPQLLADAHIPLDADLDIVCLDRKIVILPTEDVESEDVPKELLDICADLGIPREKVNIVLRMTEEENGKKQILSDAKEGAKLSK